MGILLYIKVPISISNANAVVGNGRLAEISRAELANGKHFCYCYIEWMKKSGPHKTIGGHFLLEALWLDVQHKLFAYLVEDNIHFSLTLEKKFEPLNPNMQFVIKFWSDTQSDYRMGVTNASGNWRAFQLRPGNW